MADPAPAARILVVTTSFPTRENPAAGIFIKRMLDRLPAHHMRVSVLAPAGTGSTAFCKSGSIQTFFFRYAPRPLQLLAQQPGGIPAAVTARPWVLLLLPFFSLSLLVQAVRFSRRADLIHAQWSFCGLLAGVAGKLTATPVVTTLRGTDIQWAQGSFVFRQILHLAVRFSRRVVAVSQTMAERVTLWEPGSSGKIEVIGNGVAACTTPVQSQPAPIFRVVIIGNLVAGKGVELAIRAAAGLSGHARPAHLTVIGDGPLRKKLQALGHSLAIARRIEFAGVLAPDAVTARLIGCHALVLASRSEGRPNVVLEAMAAGVPVVAGDIAEVRGLVRHAMTGLLYPVGDVDSLAFCLGRLRDDPPFARKLAANAHRWLNGQGLSWTRCAAAYAALYQRVIADHKREKAPCAA